VQRGGGGEVILDIYITKHNYIQLDLYRR